MSAQSTPCDIHWRECGTDEPGTNQILIVLQEYPLHLK